MWSKSWKIAMAIAPRVIVATTTRLEEELVKPERLIDRRLARAGSWRGDLCACVKRTVLMLLSGSFGPHEVAPMRLAGLLQFLRRWQTRHPSPKGEGLERAQEVQMGAREEQMS
jgi:hypothetical protein